MLGFKNLAHNKHSTNVSHCCRHCLLLILLAHSLWDVELGMYLSPHHILQTLSVLGRSPDAICYPHSCPLMRWTFRLSCSLFLQAGHAPWSNPAHTCMPTVHALGPPPPPRYLFCKAPQLCLGLSPAAGQLTSRPEPQMRSDQPEVQGRLPSLIWDSCLYLSASWQLLHPADSLRSEVNQNPQAFFLGTAWALVDQVIQPLMCVIQFLKITFTFKSQRLCMKWVRKTQREKSLITVIFKWTDFQKMITYFCNQEKTHTSHSSNFHFRVEEKELEKAKLMYHRDNCEF